MTFPSRRLRADLLLLLAALLWGSAFVPQKHATDHLGPFLFNGLRFLLGAAILLPWVRPRQWPSKNFFRWAAITGILLVGAAACQQAGLKYTTAGKAGFLTGLYVVLVPVVLFAVWRQKMAWRSWAGALVAAVGVFLLSMDDQFRFGLGEAGLGDALVLVGAVLWAFHVVIVGRAVTQVEVLLFSVGQYLVAGSLNLILGLALEADTLPGLAYCWRDIVYIGIFSVAAGYTLQAVGQKHAPAADAAIILSLEAVFAALFGYLLLKESLGAWQLVGCALILAAVAIVQQYGTRDPAT
ncbi:MAG: DMT family transporter [Planctomycetota bacterium]